MQVAQRTGWAPLPLVGRGWGRGSSCEAKLVHNRTTPTPALRADPPHKGEGKTEFVAWASISSQ